MTATINEPSAGREVAVDEEKLLACFDALWSDIIEADDSEIVRFIWLHRHANKSDVAAVIANNGWSQAHCYPAKITKICEGNVEFFDARLRQSKAAVMKRSHHHQRRYSLIA